MGLKRSAPMKRTTPLRAAGWRPPRPAKVVEYTPRPRAVAVASIELPMAEPVPKGDPWRSEAYRRLVAAEPCIWCGRPGRSQAAHGPTMGAMLKAPDWLIFPLCAEGLGELGCHYKFDKYILFNAEERRERAVEWAATIRARLLPRALALGIDVPQVMP